MATEVVINTKQKSTLKQLLAVGKVSLSIPKIDKRTLNALSARGLVKVVETKKGSYAAPTARGKRFFN